MRSELNKPTPPSTPKPLAAPIELEPEQGLVDARGVPIPPSTPVPDQPPRVYAGYAENHREREHQRNRPWNEPRDRGVRRLFP